MKNIMFKMAGTALGLSLCLGAYASPSIPVSMAPVKPNDIIIVTGPHYYVVVTRPVTKSLQTVDQAAEFDRTN